MEQNLKNIGLGILMSAVPKPDRNAVDVEDCKWLILLNGISHGSIRYVSEKCGKKIMLNIIEKLRKLFEKLDEDILSILNENGFIQES